MAEVMAIEAGQGRRIAFLRARGCTSIGIARILELDGLPCAAVHQNSVGHAQPNNEIKG